MTCLVTVWRAIPFGLCRHCYSCIEYWGCRLLECLASEMIDSWLYWVESSYSNTYVPTSCCPFLFALTYLELPHPIRIVGLWTIACPYVSTFHLSKCLLEPFDPPLSFRSHPNDWPSSLLAAVIRVERTGANLSLYAYPPIKTKWANAPPYLSFDWY